MSNETMTDARALLVLQERRFERCVEYDEAIDHIAARLRGDAAQGEQQAVRDREADRARFPDKAFNDWLDTGISDCGHIVWHGIDDIFAAWHGWDAHRTATAPDEPAPWDLEPAAPAPVAGDAVRGEIAICLQQRNRHIDIQTARYYVDAVLDALAQDRASQEVPNVD